MSSKKRVSDLPLRKGFTGYGGNVREAFNFHVVADFFGGSLNSESHFNP